MTNSLLALGNDCELETAEFLKEDFTGTDESEILPTIRNDQSSDSTGHGEAPSHFTTYQAPQRFEMPQRRSQFAIKLSGVRHMSIKRYECVVLGVQDGFINCEMHDLLQTNGVEEYAELSVDEFNEYDRALLEEGAVFYWSIGQIRLPHGQVRGGSELRLRRLPKTSKATRNEIKEKVSRLSERLKEQQSRN